MFFRASFPKNNSGWLLLDFINGSGIHGIFVLIKKDLKIDHDLELVQGFIKLLIYEFRDF